MLRTFLLPIGAWTPALVTLIVMIAVEYISRVAGWKFLTTVLFCYATLFLVIGTVVSLVITLVAHNHAFQNVAAMTTRFIIFVGLVTAAFHVMRLRPLWQASIVAIIATFVAFPIALRAVQWVVCKTGGACS